MSMGNFAGQQGLFTAPAAAAPGTTAKPQRVLACVQCQQRKLKCNRSFPCTHCVKSGAECIQATLAPRRRRRIAPERELLERLRHYEGLLRQHNIKFNPVHTSSAGNSFSPIAHSRGGQARNDVPANRETEDGQSNVEPAVDYKAKNIWKAMNQKSQDPEHSLDSENEDDDDEEELDSSDGDVQETVIKRVWDHMYESNGNLLFGSHTTNLDLSTLHPGQAQIFRLWQIYLDNVNPLLKVTHTPTLQSRVIDAASNVANIDSTLEALMFGIYSTSILSLDEDQCLSLFASPRTDLLASYQFGCQQALLNCEYLRSGNRDCLTAFYLYLVSIRPRTDPRALSSMLGSAVRIAQRMGIHNEASYAKRSTLEAEMSRRLWWSLIIFDTRICEMSDYTSATLAPTWDCRIPLNTDDYNLRAEASKPPAASEKPTEALFAVVRSELGEFLRHSAFHLDFTNPALKAIAKHAKPHLASECDSLIALERMMEAKYFEHCDPENPLHYMTLWTARGYLAKYHLVASYSTSLKSPTQHTDAQRDAAMTYAMSLMECDTKLTSSPLTKRYQWLIHYHFPLPAYIHIAQDVRRRPFGQHAEQAWTVMSDNYSARFASTRLAEGPSFNIISKLVLQAWEAREAAFRQAGRPVETPRIVLVVQREMAEMTAGAQECAMVTAEESDLLFGMGVQDFAELGYLDMPGHGYEHGMMEVDESQLTNPAAW